MNRRFGTIEFEIEQRIRGLSETKLEELKVVLRQLNRRFGNIESDIEQRIRGLPKAKLEELTEVLLDFTTLGDLMTWLENNSKDASILFHR